MTVDHQYGAQLVVEWDCTDDEDEWVLKAKLTPDSTELQGEKVTIRFGDNALPSLELPVVVRVHEAQ